MLNIDNYMPYWPFKLSSLIVPG